MEKINQLILPKNFSECSIGKHSYIVIAKSKTATILWCKCCGSIFIDDIDNNKTLESQYRKHKSPELASRVHYETIREQYVRTSQSV